MNKRQDDAANVAAPVVDIHTADDVHLDVHSPETSSRVDLFFPGDELPVPGHDTDD